MDVEQGVSRDVYIKYKNYKTHFTNITLITQFGLDCSLKCVNHVLCTSTSVPFNDNYPTVPPTTVNAKTRRRTYFRKRLSAIYLILSTSKYLAEVHIEFGKETRGHSRGERLDRDERRDFRFEWDMQRGCAEYLASMSNGKGGEWKQPGSSNKSGPSSMSHLVT